MTALIIATAIAVIVVGLLFLPFSVDISFREDFYIKIRFASIKLFSISPEKEKKTAKKSKEGMLSPQAENGAKSLFASLSEKHGFTGAVKKLLRLALDVFTHIKKLLRHIKFKKIVLDISVAAEDAAKTAIEYGAICSAAYPVLACIDSCAGAEFKRINIKSDFELNKPSFSFSLVVKFKLFFLIIAALKIFLEYKKFMNGEENNE